MPSQSVAAEVIAQERAALDEWSAGRPTGFVRVCDPVDDALYFDSIMAWDGAEGRDAIEAYAAKLDEMVPPHSYEMQNPRVQVYGDLAILSFRYVPTMLDGTPSKRWKASSVYRRVNGAWRQVHAHWSFYDPPEG